MCNLSNSYPMTVVVVFPTNIEHPYVPFFAPFMKAALSVEQIFALSSLTVSPLAIHLEREQVFAERRLLFHRDR